MKRILFLGYVIEPNEVDGYKGISIAGNKMQWNVIKNMSQFDDIEIDSVTITPHAAFPREKVIWQRKKSVNLLSGVTSYEISYCNLPFIKQLWQVISVYRTAKKLIKANGYDTVFCFNLFPQVGIPMRWLKNKFRTIDTVCLLADLPIDDNTTRRGLSKWLRYLFERSTWKSMKTCDRYIVLNKFVVEKYLPEKSYIVVDGGVDENDIEKYPETEYNPAEHNVLFCGALTEYNGISNLLNAMELMGETDIKLDIYGGGYLEDIVKEAADRTGNIRFYGRVSNDEILKKQREAWLLINPRVIDDPISQVTFPSKTFEYLLSGTPVLSTRLNGYGKEYDDCMFWIDSSNDEEIAKAIKAIYNLDRNELISRAGRARAMIITRKTWRQQVKKIVEYLNGGVECS